MVYRSRNKLVPPLEKMFLPYPQKKMLLVFIMVCNIYELVFTYVILTFTDTMSRSVK